MLMECGTVRVVLVSLFFVFVFVFVFAEGAWSILLISSFGVDSNFLWVELEHLFFQGYNVKFV
jgi:hypothetical protein